MSALHDAESSTEANTNTVDADTERRIERFLTRKPRASSVEVMGALLIDPAKRDHVEQLIAESGTDA